MPQKCRMILLPVASDNGRLRIAHRHVRMRASVTECMSRANGATPRGLATPAAVLHRLSAGR